MVTVLTATMIGGLLTIIVLIVIRFPRVINLGRAPLPEVIELPDGTRATAFTQAERWFAVVTDDDRILIFDRDSGALLQTVTIRRPE